MFRKVMMRNYKWIMSILILLGISLILIAQIELEWLNSEYTLGLGIGLVLAATINLIVLWLKFRNSDYEEAMEIEMNDERVKMNKMRALSYSGVVAIALLCIISILHAHVEFNMVLGNTFVLLSYSASLAFFKWTLRNK